MEVHKLKRGVRKASTQGEDIITDSMRHCPTQDKNCRARIGSNSNNLVWFDEPYIITRNPKLLCAVMESGSQSWLVVFIPHLGALALERVAWVTGLAPGAGSSLAPISVLRETSFSYLSLSLGVSPIGMYLKLANRPLKTHLSWTARLPGQLLQFNTILIQTPLQFFYARKLTVSPALILLSDTLNSTLP